MSKKKLVIFGGGDIGQLAHYYFTHDSDYEVVAFTVDRDYTKEKTFCGVPLVPFDEVARQYPPAQHSMFIALSYAQLNQLRREKYEAAKKLGYTLATYVSSHATILSDAIGENCFILEDNTIQPFVTIGNNVTLWSGNHIGHHSTIADHVFIASHVVVSGGVSIGEASFLGVNATLRDHITVGSRCVVGAGTLLLDDAADETVFIGNGTEVSAVPSTRLRKL